MKNIFYILTIILLTGYYSIAQKPNSDTTTIVATDIKTETVEQEAKKKIQYTDQQLEAFLDSVGKLSPTKWMDKVSYTSDSIFQNQQQIDRQVISSDFDKLKKACKSEKLDKETAKRIFKNLYLDSTYLVMDTIPITFISFDKNKYAFNEYAICLGSTVMNWSCELFFFKANRIISKHTIYHRYGLELEHYKDIDGKTVIYYKENYVSGSGIWWYNFYFYKYYDTTLIPILNELQNGNLQFGWGFRVLWLESFIIKTNPLTIKMVYYEELSDSTNKLERIIDNSTFVQYTWDEQSKTLKGNYQKSKISKPQILSYYLKDNELLFINAYYKTLKNGLQYKKKRLPILTYLNEIKNRYDGN